MDAHEGATVHRTFAPYAVGLGDRVVFIHEQCEWQVELGPEILVALLAIGANAEDDRIFLLEVRMNVTKSARLGSTAWGIVLGVEVEHDLLSPIIC